MICLGLFYSYVFAECSTRVQHCPLKYIWRYLGVYEGRKCSGLFQLVTVPQSTGTVLPFWDSCLFARITDI